MMTLEAAQAAIALETTLRECLNAVRQASHYGLDPIAPCAEVTCCHAALDLTLIHLETAHAAALRLANRAMESPAWIAEQIELATLAEEPAPF